MSFSLLTGSVGRGGVGHGPADCGGCRHQGHDYTGQNPHAEQDRFCGIGLLDPHGGDVGQENVTFNE